MGGALWALSTLFELSLTPCAPKRNQVPKGMIPESLRPLLEMVGPSFFKAVPWTALLSEGRVLLKNMASEDRTREVAMRDHLRRLLPLERFEFGEQSPRAETQRSLGPAIQGERILELYFRQLHNPHGLFLDLRLNHWEFADDRATFHPNHLWIQLKADFQKSLKSLYLGYYQNRPELFDLGLQGLGLVASSSKPDDQAEIRDIFFEHFGPGDQSEVRFSKAEFLKSFEQIFKFMVDHKLSISGQFLHLGIYLATLYSALEHLGVPLNVRKAFLLAQETEP